MLLQLGKKMSLKYIALSTIYDKTKKSNENILVRRLRKMKLNNELYCVVMTICCIVLCTVLYCTTNCTLLYYILCIDAASGVDCDINTASVDIIHNIYASKIGDSNFT